MYVEDLFKKEKIECPLWLSKIYLEDDLIDSDYEFKNGIHNWTFKNDFKNILITFDGKEYHFKAFDDKGRIMLDNVCTENMCVDC